jgi:putative SOS response-associated peptidase YedK
MCGRYVSVARVAELIEQYKATGPGDDKQLAPSYNVARRTRSTPSSSTTVPTGQGQCGRSPRCGGVSFRT